MTMHAPRRLLANGETPGKTPATARVHPAGTHASPFGLGRQTGYALHASPTRGLHRTTDAPPPHARPRTLSEQQCHRGQAYRVARATGGCMHASHPRAPRDELPPDTSHHRAPGGDPASDIPDEVVDAL